MSTATATATATTAAATSASAAAPLQPENLFAIAQAYERSASSAIAFRRMARCDAFPWFAATRNPAFNAFLLWDAPADLVGMAAHIDKLLREDRSFMRVAVSGVDRNTGEWRGMVVVRFRGRIRRRLIVRRRMRRGGLRRILLRRVLRVGWSCRWRMRLGLRIRCR